MFHMNERLVMQNLLIVRRKEAGAVYLSFNRPERLNAVTVELYGDLKQHIQDALDDRDVRVIILTGEGRAFCVGADLKDHHTQTRTEEERRAYTEAEQQVCLMLQRAGKPFIASVNGYALGAGAEIALSCDFVVMQRSAQIGFPEISIGTYLGGGLTSLLPRLVGLAKARELIYLGKRIEGAEAERIGLIYRAVDDDRLEEETALLRDELTAKAPIPLGTAKRHLLEHIRLRPDEVMDAETDALYWCMQTEDWAEGARAFNEKRKPVFKGK
jgi:enoyl-CoA hydratase